MLKKYLFAIINAILLVINSHAQVKTVSSILESLNQKTDNETINLLPMTDDLTLDFLHTMNIDSRKYSKVELFRNGDRYRLLLNIVNSQSVIALDLIQLDSNYLAGGFAFLNSETKLYFDATILFDLDNQYKFLFLFEESHHFGKLNENFGKFQIPKIDTSYWGMVSVLLLNNVLIPTNRILAINSKPAIRTEIEINENGISELVEIINGFPGKVTKIEKYCLSIGPLKDISVLDLSNIFDMCRFPIIGMYKYPDNKNIWSFWK